MADDLIEHFERIKWARWQTGILNRWVKYFERSKPYELRYKPDEIGWMTEVWAHATQEKHSPIQIQAGVIIHELRSTLDALVCSLAWRNNKDPGTSTYFPICHEKQAFYERAAKGKIRLISDTDKALIESLEPWSGGNDWLYSLHKADNIRKHQRLLLTGSLSQGVGFFASTGWGIGDLVPGTGNLADGVLVLKAEIVNHLKIDVNVKVCFSEPAFISGKQLVPVINKFADTVQSILEIFS